MLRLISLEEVMGNLRGHVETLAQLIGPRSIYKPEKLEEAALYIERSLKDLGLQVMSQYYKVWKRLVRNLVVYLRGAPEAPYYLIGAHYDSVSHTPGADDNASAVAVLLELARLVSEERINHRTPLALVFFTLEEPPTFGTSLMGSKIFASRAKGEGHLIKGALILEMVGYYCYEAGCQKYPPFIRSIMGYPRVGNFIGLIGDRGSRALVRELLDSFRENPQIPVYSLVVPLKGYLLPASRLSDNASFWDKGFPAVMITDTAYYRNPNYHSFADTPDTLDYAKMAQLVKSLALFLERAK